MLAIVRELPNYFVRKNGAAESLQEGLSYDVVAEKNGEIAGGCRITL